MKKKEEHRGRGRPFGSKSSINECFVNWRVTFEEKIQLKTFLKKFREIKKFRENE